MPRLAMGILVFWFMSLFVFRSVLQWWRTGSTGMKGFSGAVGSVEWTAGLVTSLGFVAAPLAPVAALAGWPGGGLLFESPVAHLVGALCAGIGVAGALVAQIEMGDSWRIGVDESERTALVTRGLYRFVRNPIFSFILLSGVGLLLLVPNVYALLALAFTFVGIEVQVRVVEEPYLAAVHGTDYDDYRASTGRFVPGVGD